jgi:hypothetical protein
VDTPAGALAIRGGIVYADFKNAKTYSILFVFGDYAKLGNQPPVYEPGNGYFSLNGQTIIKPFTAADLKGIMASLTNSSTGGLGTPTEGSTPAPTMVDTQSLSELISDANATQIQSELVAQLNQPTGQPQPDPIPPETVVLPDNLSLRVLTAPDFYVANQRSFWSPGLFIANPGAQGILGGDDKLVPCFLAPQVCGSPYGFFQVQTDDFDVHSNSIANGRIQGTIEPLIERTGFSWWGPTYGKTPETQFDFPIFNVVGVHEVTDARAIEVIDGVTHTTTLVGSAFTGRGGGFFAYQLFEVGENGQADLNEPVLAFGGTAFQKPEGETEQVRLFNLYTDPRQDISVPFAAKQTAPTNLAGATIQPLYLLEGGENGRSVWLQTSFLIQGQGPGQETILVLALGEQDENGQLVGVRRGMSHINLILDPDNNPATPGINRGMQTINLAGQIATLAGPGGGEGQAYMFGDQLPHFIIGADSTGTGHNVFQDQPLNPQAWSAPNLNIQTHNILPPPPPPSFFTGATYHIGEQVGQVGAPQPVTTNPEGLDFYGYAAGIYQQTTGNLEGDEAPVGVLLNSNPTQVHLKFKTDNRLSALFDLHGAGEDGDGGAKLAFGDWGNAHGRSAVINGDIYAAVESATQDTKVTVDGFYAGQHIERTAEASLYLVSGALLNPNVQPCTQCNFIKWGTWGGQLQFKDGFGYSADDVTADVNLGWYVAGELSTVGQIDTLAASGATATYTGSVIGNVASLTQTGWNTYVATGNLNMNWSFQQRSGGLTISNFDNRSYGTGPTGLTQVPNINQPNSYLNQFTGSLTQLSGPSINLNSGNATGSFVNNGSTPAAGVIGNWTVQGDAYGATGVFAGRR